MNGIITIVKAQALIRENDAKKVKILPNGAHVYKTPTGGWIVVKQLDALKARVKTTGCACG